MYYINENVKELNRIFDQNSREGFLRLDLNENPGGLPKEFIHKVLSGITPEFVSKYPETADFQQFLADYLGVDYDEICLTNGSAEAIRHIIEAYSRPGGKILSVTPSYAMYEVFAKMYGRIHIGVPYREAFKADINDILNAITDDIDLVVLLNPNNPVGDVYSEDEMVMLLDKAEACQANVLIDEAYFYFYPNSFGHFAFERSNVIVTRTFSKLFSLAGLRLGYCISRKENINLVQKLCTPHNVNAFALRFVRAILEEDGMLEDMISKQKAGRAYLINDLESNGYRVTHSEGNFVFIETKTNAKKMAEKLKNKKILVKYYSTPGYDDLIRVTIGEESIMKEFLKVFYELDRA